MNYQHNSKDYEFTTYNVFKLSVQAFAMKTVHNIKTKLGRA